MLCQGKSVIGDQRNLYLGRRSAQWWNLWTTL